MSNMWKAYHKPATVSTEKEGHPPKLSGCNTQGRKGLRR